MQLRLSIFYLIILLAHITFSQSTADSTGNFKWTNEQKTARQLISVSELDSATTIAEKMLLAHKKQPLSYWNGVAIVLKADIDKKKLDHLNAVEKYLRAKDLYTILDSTKQLMEVNYELFLIYKKENQNDLALAYCHEALACSEKLKDTSGLARWYNAIGNTYLRMEHFELAMDAERKSLSFAQAINHKQHMSFALSTIGEIHYLKEAYDSADFYMMQALQIKYELGMGTAWLFSKIGKLRIEQGKLDEAIGFCEKGYLESIKKNDVGVIARNCDCLQQAYSKTGDFAKAYHFQSEFLALNNLQLKEEELSQLTRMNFELKYKQQALSDSVAFAKESKINKAIIDLQTSKLNHANTIRTYLFIGLGLVVVFLLFMINRFQIIKKQKALIAIKKDEADRLSKESEHHRLIAVEKNNELVDSINYAKRIQAAILPPITEVKKEFPESFVLYKPKAIVAGDFYWFEKFEDTVLLAAADCTGHGVPGAMVSVICNNGLNRSVREYGLRIPGLILDKTREIVTTEFEKAENEVKDGMDIALVAINGLHLKFAGANNPIWIIRNGEVLKTKGDKQPVGKFDHQAPFATHSIDLQKGDAIYLFSDGFQDQFGGEHGKKFKAKAFIDLLLSCQDKLMEEQMKIIDQTFERWRGKLEQLDDVCVIGVKV